MYTQKWMSLDVGYPYQRTTTEIAIARINTFAISLLTTNLDDIFIRFDWNYLSNFIHEENICFFYRQTEKNAQI